MWGSAGIPGQGGGKRNSTVGWGSGGTALQGGPSGPKRGLHGTDHPSTGLLRQKEEQQGHVVPDVAAALATRVPQGPVCSARGLL